MPEREGDISNSENLGKDEGQEFSTDAKKEKEEVKDVDDEKKGKIEEREEKKPRRTKEQLKSPRGSIFHEILSYVSSYERIPKALQETLNIAQEAFKKKEITKKQFQTIEQSVNKRLAQGEKSETLSTEGREEKRTPLEEGQKSKEEAVFKKEPKKEEKAKEASEQKKVKQEKEMIPTYDEFKEAEDSLFGKAEKLWDQARLYEEKDKEMPKEIAEAAMRAGKVVVERLKNKYKPGADFLITPEQREELEKDIPEFRKELEETGKLDKYAEWIRKRVYALNEEYANERFDTNFTLTWPIQQALNKLWPKESDYKDKKAEIIDSTRKQLTAEFEAHRNFHNFIYLYKRVSGVGQAVEASNLFDVRQVEVLIKKPGIANYLRQFEVLGERCESLTNEKLELDIREGSPDIERVDEINEEIDLYTKKAQNLQIGKEFRRGEPSEDIKKDRWAAIMAGGIYSALHQAGKSNLVMNTGDFFIGRLYNVDTKAKELWEGSWKRTPFVDLYKAVELRPGYFWEDFLEKRLETFRKNDRKYWERYKEIKYYSQSERDQLKKLEGKKKFKKLKDFQKKLEEKRASQLRELHEGKLKPLQEKFWNDFKIKLTLKINSQGELKIKDYSLKEALFDRINFKEMPDNEITRMDVELLDADPVRKSILKPQQFIEYPSSEKLKSTWVDFQHLKGGKRSTWYKNVLDQLCQYYQDQTAPGIENLPLILRRCRAQEINSDYRGWSNALIEGIIGGFAPPLTDEDKEELLKKFVGTKLQRNFAKAWKNIALVTGLTLVGAVKGFFVEFFKYITEEKR